MNGRAAMLALGAGAVLLISLVGGRLLANRDSGPRPEWRRAVVQAAAPLLAAVEGQRPVHGQVPSTLASIGLRPPPPAPGSRWFYRRLDPWTYELGATPNPKDASFDTYSVVCTKETGASGSWVYRQGGGSLLKGGLPLIEWIP